MRAKANDVEIAAGRQTLEKYKKCRPGWLNAVTLHATCKQQYFSRSAILRLNAIWRTCKTKISLPGDLLLVLMRARDETFNQRYILLLLYQVTNVKAHGYIPTHLHHWLSATPDCLLLVIELFQSPLLESETVRLNTSPLHTPLMSSSPIWRPICPPSPIPPPNFYSTWSLQTLQSLMLLIKT